MDVGPSPEYPCNSGVSRRTLLRFAPLPAQTVRWALSRPNADELLDNVHVDDLLWVEVFETVVAKNMTAPWASPHPMNDTRYAHALEVVLAADPALAARPLAWLLRDRELDPKWWPEVVDVLCKAANHPARSGGSRRSVVSLCETSALPTSVRRGVTSGLAIPDRAAALIAELAETTAAAEPTSTVSDVWFLLGPQQQSWFPADDTLLLTPVAELAARRPDLAAAAVPEVLVANVPPEDRAVLLVTLSAWETLGVDHVAELCARVPRRGAHSLPNMFNALSQCPVVPDAVRVELEVPDAVSAAAPPPTLLKLFMPAARPWWRRTLPPPRPASTHTPWHPLTRPRPERFSFSRLTGVIGGDPWAWCALLVVCSEGQYSMLELAAAFDHIVEAIGGDTAAWRALCEIAEQPVAQNPVLGLDELTAVAGVLRS